MPSDVAIKVRRGSNAAWIAANPVLSAGELGLNTDNNRLKVGNGTLAWNSLSYINIAPSDVNEATQDYIGAFLQNGTHDAINVTYNDTLNTIAMSIDRTVVVDKTSVQTITNKTISGTSNTLSNIANSSLSHSSITINGSVIPLGGTLNLNSFTDPLTFSNIVYIGTGASGFAGVGDANLTNPALVVRFDNNQEESSYAQIAFQNDDPTSSSDIIVYMDNGTDNAGFWGLGISGSQFDDTTYGITGPGDFYLFGNTKDNTYKGNMVLATGNGGSENKIIFAAGGYSTGNTQMVIVPDQSVQIAIDTPSTSPSTGALVVNGGVGITGDVNIAGNISFGGTGTSTSTNNLSVSDSMIFLGNNNSGDALDLGVVGEYKVSSVTKYAGYVRDASDGVIKFFKDVATKPISTVDFTGIAYADLKAASIFVDSATIGSVTNSEIGYLSGVTSALQTQLDSKAVYPTQTSNSGKYLTTNGTSVSWATVDALPSQTGNSGKYLTTNGTTASWSTINLSAVNDNLIMQIMEAY